jgi:hypothetical protein
MFLALTPHQLYEVRVQKRVETRQTMYTWLYRAPHSRSDYITQWQTTTRLDARHYEPT